MDHVLHNMKSLFPTNRTSHDNGLAAKPPRQPMVFEGHELDTDLPGPANLSGTAARPALSAAPAMQTATASATRATGEQPNAQLQPAHDEQSFCAAAQSGDLESVRQHMAAGLNVITPLCKAAIHCQTEVVQLLLQKATDSDKSEAIWALLGTSPDSPNAELLTDIGALILNEHSSLNAVARHIGFGNRMGFGLESDEARSLRDQRWKAIESKYLCMLARNGNLEKLKELDQFYFELPDQARFTGALVEAARTNHADIVRLLLAATTEQAKVDALVTLTFTAAEAYPYDSFVETGREIFQALQDRETSFAAVRSRTAPKDPMESTMVPDILNDISRPRIGQKDGKSGDVNAVRQHGLPSAPTPSKHDAPGQLAAGDRNLALASSLLAEAPCLEDEKEALTDLARQMTFTRDELERKRLAQAASVILLTTPNPIELQDTLSRALASQGDGASAKALRSIRLS